jgi:hypothetical protein
VETLLRTREKILATNVQSKLSIILNLIESIKKEDHFTIEKKTTTTEELE